MAYLSYGSHTIRYELSGPETGPAYVLVNGLTQYAELWDAYRDALVAKHFRVVTFDLLGQGESDKPSLFISQDDHVAVLRPPDRPARRWPDLPCRYQFRRDRRATLRDRIWTYDWRVWSPMSTFAELSPQLFLLGNVMRTGLILGGTSYLQDMLLPMNLSDAWLAPLLDKLETVKRQGWLVNDVYALQNLMESFLDFKPLTPELHRIKIPTMILNGEFDFLTPRPLHDNLRSHIPDSALVIIPRGYHAFTLEKSALTADLLVRFATDVMAKQWKGGGSVWIAPDEAGGEIEPFPEGYDHLRALPIRRAPP